MVVAEVFGILPDGEEVTRVTIAHHGLTASILTQGARLQDLRLQGISHPLVLGFPTLADYLTDGMSYGSIAGPVANRIGQAKAVLDGETLRFEPNFVGRHTLHGGSAGTARRNWRVEAWDDASVTLSLKLSDGDGGFPGNRDIRLIYSIDDGPALRLLFTAETDRPTFCNLAQHSYFNLDGAPDITAHELMIAAATFTKTDEDLIPTGKLQPVEGTGFDFTEPRFLNDPKTLRTLDTNFCVQDRQLATPAFAARLTAGITVMDIFSTEPGLQAYAGAHLKRGPVGIGGTPYGPNAGIALESQGWPDAPNHADFPSIVLRPGQPYRQETILKFRRRG